MTDDGNNVTLFAVAPKVTLFAVAPSTSAAGVKPPISTSHFPIPLPSHPRHRRRQYWPRQWGQVPFPSVPVAERPCHVPWSAPHHDRALLAPTGHFPLRHQWQCLQPSGRMLEWAPPQWYISTMMTIMTSAHMAYRYSIAHRCMRNEIKVKRVSNKFC